jgi:hypothetical protein
MPRVDIDEAELAANRQLASLVAEMQANPKSRKILEQAVKEIRPNAVAPVTTYQNEVLDEFERRLDAREARKAAEDQQKQFAAQWESQKAELRKQRYLEDRITEAEKFAIENGIANLEAAMSLLDKKFPAATIASPSSSWNFFEQPTEGGEQFVKDLLGNKGEDERGLSKQIAQALKDARGQ